MSDNPQNEYLKAKVMTASPQQLQTMLYDGAIRFCEQAKVAIAERDIATTHARIVRAQRIVVELSSGLNPKIEPELCGKMASLYNYVYRLLVDANLNRDLDKIDEALRLLHHMRETWLMALDKLRQENAEQAPASPLAAMAAAPAPAPQTPGEMPLAGGMLSIEG